MTPALFIGGRTYVFPKKSVRETIHRMSLHLLEIDLDGTDEKRYKYTE